MTRPIHDEDLWQSENDHVDALTQLQALGIARFEHVSDILIALQDKAYALGLERGKLMQQEAEQ